uniref:uncharacterized protein LOC114588662 n=1 Tax=Podarcis muralis TaxID=64176 RepID=UPI0010A09855|nr:uncharacterized protein LOC114588662 [Podarcis muralis]
MSAATPGLIVNGPNFLSPSRSRSRDEELEEFVEGVDEGWNTDEPSPEVSFIIPEVVTDLISETDLTERVHPPNPPPSLEGVFRNNLLEEPNFAIESVLGEMRANILTAAEEEARALASELRDDEDEDDNRECEPHSVLTCRICQLFVRTVDRLLDKSEELMDHYLPLTEEEIGNLKKAVAEIEDTSIDHRMQACLVRINDLSNKLRQRAYMMALSKLRFTRRSTQASINQLHETLEVIDQVQHRAELEIGPSNERMSMICVEWSANPRRNSAQGNEDFSTLDVGVPRAQSTMVGREGPGAPREHNTTIEREEIGLPAAQSTMIECEEIGLPAAQSTMIECKEIGLPPAHSTIVECEEITCSKVEMTPTEVEMLPIPISPPEIVEVPQPAIIIPVSIEVPPPPILIPVKVEMAPAPIIIPVKVEMPPAPTCPRKKDPTYRDVSNITLTAPGCDEEDEITLRMRDEEDENDSPTSEIEAKTLAKSRSVTQNLQGTYENLVASLKDIPEELRNKLSQTSRHIRELHSDFVSAHNFGDLADNVLNKSFAIMAEAQGSMDELMEYALQSPESLLRLKDYLPNPDMKEEEVVKDAPLFMEKEEAEVQSSHSQEMEGRNILKIQQAYDPKDCDEEASTNKEEELQPSQKWEMEGRNILKIQQAYDPKGCEEEEPSSKEEVVQRSSKPVEDILKIQATYDPKDCDDESYTVKDDDETPSRKEETPPPGKKEAKEWNILKILQAYTPKFADDRWEEMEEEAAPTSQEEDKERNILKIQQAYDPKGCDEEASMNKEEEVQPSDKWEMEGWSILKLQQTYDPKGCDEETPSRKGEEEVVQLSGQVVEDILKIQETYDPKGCDDESYTGKEEKVFRTSGTQEMENDEAPSRREEIPPAGKEEAKEWKILKILQAYTPKFADDRWEEMEDDVAPTSQEEDGERNILKIQQAYDPIGCLEEASMNKEEEVQPSDKWEMEGWSILKLQQTYDPKGCDEETPSRKGEEEVVQHSGKVVEDTLKIQATYDPKGCDDDSYTVFHDESPSSRKEMEVPPPRQEDKERNILKIQQAYDPKACDEGASTNKEEVQPSGKQEMDRRNILKIQQAYDPKSCEEEAPSRKEEVVQSSGKPVEDILKIQATYDPKGCDDESYTGKEAKVFRTPDNDKVQNDKTHSRKEEKVPPSGQEEAKDWKILKMLQAYTPKFSEGESPSGREKAEVVVAPPPQREVREWNILKLQQAYDPKGCDEDSSIFKEEAQPSGKPEMEGWNILKIQQAYDPKGCDDESPKEEFQHFGQWNLQGYNILKIQQAYDPKSCPDDDK